MANRIEELLEEQGYKPATFARKAGISVTTFYEILNGTRKFENVGVARVIKMARCFGVSVEYLSGEQSERESQYVGFNERIIEISEQMNADGRAELMNYASYLASQDRFRKKDGQDTEDQLSEIA